MTEDIDSHDKTISGGETVFVHMRMPVELKEVLTKYAKKKGIFMTTLIRIWLIEKSEQLGILSITPG